ncbi:MAG: orotidine 5'-phosphate decarboxylase / HUMPS family protein [Armatimonadota bacterium]
MSAPTSTVPPLPIRPPIVQVAIDVLEIPRALRIAEAAVRAGVDWLEAGTPLITFQGVSAIGALAREFPEHPVLADFKMMDGVRKYVLATAEQGGRIATICGVSSDASIRTAVQAGRDSGVRVLCDLYAATDGPRRAAEVEALGVDSVYIHYGADQRGEDPDRDPALFLDQIAGRTRTPVGVGTFSVANGVDAVRRGADIVVIGVPFILEDDPTESLREYVLRVKEAWHARRESR